MHRVGDERVGGQVKELTVERIETGLINLHQQRTNREQL